MTADEKRPLAGLGRDLELRPAELLHAQRVHVAAEARRRHFEVQRCWAEVHRLWKAQRQVKTAKGVECGLAFGDVVATRVLQDIGQRSRRIRKRSDIAALAISGRAHPALDARLFAWPVEPAVVEHVPDPAVAARPALPAVAPVVVGVGQDREVLSLARDQQLLRLLRQSQCGQTVRCACSLAAARPELHADVGKWLTVRQVRGPHDQISGVAKRVEANARGLHPQANAGPIVSLVDGRIHDHQQLADSARQRWSEIDRGLNLLVRVSVRHELLGERETAGRLHVLLMLAELQKGTPVPGFDSVDLGLERGLLGRVDRERWRCHRIEHHHRPTWEEQGRLRLADGEGQRSLGN